jgi:ABC-type Fe3+-siderophore transport system permease subunit
MTSINGITSSAVLAIVLQITMINAQPVPNGNSEPASVKVKRDTVNSGYMAIAAIGGVVAVAIVGSLAWNCWKHRRVAQAKKQQLLVQSQGVMSS